MMSSKSDSSKLKGRALSCLAILFLLVFYTSSSRSEPIHDAVKAGDLRKIEQLVALNPNLVRQADSAGLTPLTWAAEKGHVDILEFLLSNGCTVNDVTSKGFTPLHAAVAAQ